MNWLMRIIDWLGDILFAPDMQDDFDITSAKQLGKVTDDIRRQMDERQQELLK